MNYPDCTPYIVTLHGANRPNCGVWEKIGRAAADRLAAMWAASAPGRTSTIEERGQ